MANKMRWLFPMVLVGAVGAYGLSRIEYSGTKQDAESLKELSSPTQSISLDNLWENIDPEYDNNIFNGMFDGTEGMFVFDDDGYYRGFLNTNSSKIGGAIPGPGDKVVGVLLRDGKIQNPDGTPSAYKNPIEYLMKTVKPIKEPKYHVSNMLK